MKKHQLGFIIDPYRQAAVVTSAWNPAAAFNGVLTNSNRVYTASASASGGARGIQGYAANSATDLYFEVAFSGVDAQATIGIANASSGTLYPGATGNALAYYGATGQKTDGGGNVAYGASWADGDVIGVRLNNGVLSFYKNGVSQGTAYTMSSAGYTSTVFYPAAGKATTTGTRAFSLNTGYTGFFSGLPSGASAWG